MDKKKLTDKIVSKEKKKLKKKSKRLLHRILACMFGTIGLFCTGYLFGMHHHLIVAMMKGEEAPKAPKGKCPFA